MTLTAQRHTHTHTEAGVLTHTHTCIHIRNKLLGNKLYADAGNEQKAPEAGRQKLRRVLCSPAHLQATDTQSHNSREQVNTPQAFFSHAPLLSPGNTGPSHNLFLSHTALYSYIYVDELYIYKGIQQGNKRRKDFHWLLLILLLRKINDKFRKDHLNKVRTAPSFTYQGKKL